MSPDVTEAKPKASGRQRLSRDMILDHALAIAARPGVGSLRIRDLGKELGADPSAIYRHFSSKNQLLEGLILRIEAQILARVDARNDRDWREVLVDISETSLDLYLRYPVVGAEAASLATESTDIVEQILAALRRGGLRGDALVEHYTLFASYLLSFSGALARSRIEYEDGLVNRAWAEDVRAATASSHPVANEYRERILALRDVDVYRSGIRLILDSAARAAAG